MMNKNITIKPMAREDLEDVAAIERSVFPDPWSYGMFADQLGLPQIYDLITARINDEVVGYGGLLRIRDEGHITNLAVKPELHSQGLGKTLIYFLFLLALREGVNSMSLEVRTTNRLAQNLYKKFGLKTIAVRKNYYGYEEDALIMAVENIRSGIFQKKLAFIRESLNFRIEDCLNLAS